jgi:hypothetical protein
MISEKAYKVIDDRSRFINTHRTKELILNQLLIFVFSVFPAFSQIDTTDVKQQKPNTAESSLSLFDSDELLDITLRFDVTGYLKKSTPKESFDAVMTLHFSETDSLNKKITIKYRGTSRNERCKFPPIQINFKKPVYINS